jgi:hypothetical protein
VGLPKPEKLVLDVELALRWAYQLELLHHDGLFPLGMPKLAAPGWVKMIDTGTVVDETRQGRFPVGAGTPHRDALTLDFLVRSLPDVRVDWRKQRAYLMGDLALWLSENDCIVSAMTTAPIADVIEGRDRRGNKFAEAKLRRRPDVAPRESCVREMVQMHARLGNRPVWDLGRPTVQKCRPVMVGRQTGKNRFTEGSHCPLQLVPPAQEMACARWEYSVWHNALVELSSVELSCIKLLPPKAPARPWVGGEPQPEMIRVLPDRTAKPAQEKLPLTPKRDKALPQVPSARHGPVRYLPVPPRKRRLTTPDDVA